jgi:hypothetical protein
VPRGKKDPCEKDPNKRTKQVTHEWRKTAQSNKHERQRQTNGIVTMRGESIICSRVLIASEDTYSMEHKLLYRVIVAQLVKELSIFMKLQVHFGVHGRQYQMNPEKSLKISQDTHKNFVLNKRIIIKLSSVYIRVYVCK